MNSGELLNALNITPRQLAKWVKAGLPHTRKGNRRQFDPTKIREWLLAKGLASNAAGTVNTAGEVAAHFGVSERTVRAWLSTDCPGSHGDYRLDAIAAWREARHQPDPMLAGPTSPMMERYRGARAKLAELELAQRQGRLVDQAEAMTCWTILARRLRQAGAGLQKAFGPAAAKILNEAIEDCLREVQDTFEKASEAAQR